MRRPIGEWTMFRQPSCDLAADRVGTRQCLIIPEPQDGEAVRGQKGISSDVRGGIQMLATVEFDHKLPFEADEIHHVRPDGALAAELASKQTTVAQPVPESLLGVRRPAAKDSGERGFLTSAHPCFLYRRGGMRIEWRAEGWDRGKVEFDVGAPSPLPLSRKRERGKTRRFLTRTRRGRSSPFLSPAHGRSSPFPSPACGRRCPKGG